MSPAVQRIDLSCPGISGARPTTIAAVFVQKAQIKPGGEEVRFCGNRRL